MSESSECWNAQSIFSIAEARCELSSLELLGVIFRNWKCITRYIIGCRKFVWALFMALTHCEKASITHTYQWALNQHLCEDNHNSMFLTSMAKKQVITLVKWKCSSSTKAYTEIQLLHFARSFPRVCQVVWWTSFHL